MRKADIEVIKELLHAIVSEVSESDIVPNEFTDPLIIILAKEGRLTLFSNWCGITASWI